MAGAESRCVSRTSAVSLDEGNGKMANNKFSDTLDSSVLADAIVSGLNTLCDCGTTYEAIVVDNAVIVESFHNYKRVGTFVLRISPVESPSTEDLDFSQAEVEDSSKKTIV